MAGILEGVKVLEAGQIIAIPSAGAMFADWGAEVIKVEPITGEQHRRSTGVSVMEVKGGAVDWRFQMANRNKKDLAIDLKTDAGKEILHKLITKIDVFISNYELDSLNKLKLDYNTLSKINPRLIYGFITAFGSKGPDSAQRGFAMSGWARAGAQYLQTEPGGFPPPLPAGMIDRVTASDLVAGILAALIHRDKTGEGQKLEASLYQSTIWAAATNIQGALVGHEMPKEGRAKARNPLLLAYRTRDERMIQLAMMLPGTDWAGFARAIDKPELADDPRFTTEEAREEHKEVLIPMLDEVIATRDLEEWERRFTENNCIYARVQTPVEVTTDPQALANDFFAEIHHPVAGDIRVVGTPVNFYQNPATVSTYAPETGQHNDEILSELGYNSEEIASLREENVIL